MAWERARKTAESSWEQAYAEKQRRKAQDKGRLFKDKNCNTRTAIPIHLFYDIWSARKLYGRVATRAGSNNSKNQQKLLQKNWTGIYLSI